MKVTLSDNSMKIGVQKGQGYSCHLLYYTISKQAQIRVLFGRQLSITQDRSRTKSQENSFYTTD